MTDEIEKDLDRAIIEPRRGRAEPSVPSAVMMAFTESDLGVVREALAIGHKPARRLDFSNMWTLDHPFEGVGLSGPALGSPASVLLLERLVALGARWIISVGSCGSIQPGLRIGRIILPTGAVSEEGTSAHYRSPRAKTAPAPDLLGDLRRKLSGQGLHICEGAVWTTDAPFRETVGKVRRYAKEGVLAVDMETSALMCVSSYRGISFSSVLVVSDELGELRWKRGFDEKAFRDSLAIASRTAASVLKERVSK